MDFPDPEGPTMAVVLPASNEHVRDLRTFKSGLVGYKNSTSLKSIYPLILS